MTNHVELSDLAAQTNTVDIQLMTIKRHEEILRSKIMKLVRILASQNLRVPTNQTFLRK
jgi:chaperonin cofactor prefoldin